MQNQIHKLKDQTVKDHLKISNRKHSSIPKMIEPIIKQCKHL